MSRLKRVADLDLFRIKKFCACCSRVLLGNVDEDGECYHSGNHQ